MSSMEKHLVELVMLHAAQQSDGTFLCPSDGEYIPESFPCATMDMLAAYLLTTPEALAKEAWAVRLDATVGKVSERRSELFERFAR